MAALLGMGHNMRVFWWNDDPLHPVEAMRREGQSWNIINEAAARQFFAENNGLKPEDFGLSFDLGVGCDL